MATSAATFNRCCDSTSPVFPRLTGLSRQTATSGGGGRVGMEYFANQEPEAIAREAARQAVLLQSAQEAPAGPMPVVLGPGDAGVLLHEAVGHGLEADFNRKKTSNYSDRVGDAVASSLCTIVDDGTILNSRGSINIDDEGNPGPRQYAHRAGDSARLHAGSH